MVGCFGECTSLSNYLSLVAAEEKSAKQALLWCMGTVVTRILDKVGVIKRTLLLKYVKKAYSM